MQLGKNIWILDLVRHSHGFHKARNSAMLHCDLAGGSIREDDLPAQLVSLVTGCGRSEGRRRIRFGSGMASGEHYCDSSGDEQESAFHISVYNPVRVQTETISY